MRKIFSTVALLTAIFMLAPTFARAGGQDTPFPLDFPLPFPWGTIEGTWQVESQLIPTEFIFEIARDCDNRQILRVTQRDPATGEIIAQGIGYRMKDTTTVYAGMKGRNGSYQMVVGAYKETPFDFKRFLGLRLFPFGPGSEIRYRISRKNGGLPFDHSQDSTTCVVQ